MFSFGLFIQQIFFEEFDYEVYFIQENISLEIFFSFYTLVYFKMFQNANWSFRVFSLVLILKRQDRVILFGTHGIFCVFKSIYVVLYEVIPLSWIIKTKLKINKKDTNTKHKKRSHFFVAPGNFVFFVVFLTIFTIRLHVTQLERLLKR